MRRNLPFSIPTSISFRSHFKEDWRLMPILNPKKSALQFPSQHLSFDNNTVHPKSLLFLLTKHVTNPKKTFKKLHAREMINSPFSWSLRHKHHHFGCSHMQIPHTLIWLCEKPVTHYDIKRNCRNLLNESTTGIYFTKR